MKEPWDFIDFTWVCCRCRKEYDNGPNGVMPEAYEIKTAENGRRFIAGKICRKCTEKKQ